MALLSHRTPTETERRLFVVLPVAYAALVLAVLPIARLPSFSNPAVATVSGVGIGLADFCTALLLAFEYRRSGRIALVYLYAAFTYSALMALLHVLTFPGAFIDGPVFGNSDTVGWLFPFWRLGMIVLLLLGIINATAPAVERSHDQRRRILTQAIRRDARTRKIRLIALTGMGQQADVAATRASGFIAHLTKPASPEDVRRLAAGEHAKLVSITHYAQRNDSVG